ncbi:MAG: SdrD B-like domain-containing protein [Bacteroidota bacterium]|jgi:hypothetical protein
MKHIFTFFALLFAIALPALAQSDVPPVISPDDSLPVPGTVMLDPSDHPVTFHSVSFFDVFTDLSLDFSASSGKEAPRKEAPLKGTVSILRFDGEASASFSSNSGGTVRWHPAVAASMRMQLTNDSGGVQTYSTEMLQLDISGGGQPLMLRESPTLHSTGQTKLRESPTKGYMVSSFFDVFLELSVDGGATWTPADNSVRLETKPTPTFVPDIAGDVVSPPGISIGDLNGDGHPDLVVTDRASSPPMPPVGSSVTNSFSCDVLYLFGGLQRSSNGACSVRYTHTFDDGTTQYFDAEMLQLDISGGTLPGGVMVRESPSKASLGRTSVRASGGGGYMVSSFFDVFTELSLDGGSTWTPQPPFTLAYADTIPASSGSTQACLPVATYFDDLWPSDGDVDFQTPPPQGTPPPTWSNGMSYQWTMLSRPAGSSSARLALPTLGTQQVYDTDVDCDMQISFGAGLPMTDLHLTGHETVRMSHSSDNGQERDFDQEMLALDLSGNLGSAGTVMLRESPSKASLGRHTVTPNGSGFRISSFFDVYTEISLDGGVTWSASNDSVRLEQQLLAPPAPSGALSSSGGGLWAKSNETCGNGLFADGTQMARVSFFNVAKGFALPPSGGSALTMTDATCRATLSLDNGNSFFDVFLDVSLALQVTAADSTPTGNVYYLEVKKDSTKIHLRESPTLSHLRLRESPTLPSKGMVVASASSGKPGASTCSAFFDIFTEISLDDGATWSPSTSAMRIELDTAVAGSIAGMKWHDVNGNGVLDPGETGLANWKIALLDTAGNIVDTVRTDVSGNYAFTNVPAGTYRVLENGQPGWILTSGLPVYGFSTAPGDSISGVNFGNFQAPSLSGVAFNDHNGNGSRDPGEEGLQDRAVGLIPGSNQNPAISVHGITGSFSLRLNGIVAPGQGTAVGYTYAKRAAIMDNQRNVISLAAKPGKKAGRHVSDYRSIGKGWDGTVKGTKFEDGDIPTQMDAFELHSTSTVQLGGNPYTVTCKLKEYTGHVSLLKLYDDDGRMIPSTSGQTISSFFDIFLECDLTPPPGSSSGGMTLFGEIVLEGDLDGDAVDPLETGKTYRGGAVTLLDSNGIAAGHLDSLTFLVGPPASGANPASMRTDTAGQYSFATMFPGTWGVIEQTEPCLDQTTTAPSPITVTSGATITPVNFGTRAHGGTLCVTKYYDRNHNQQLDPGELPMSGVTFILTGLNPSNAFSGQTDTNGAVCFTGLPPDSYTLHESVPPGYAVSFPASGTFNFVVSNCESTSVQWLNSAALSDTTFRTATMQDWANALQSVKCKASAADFQFVVKVPPPNVTKGVSLNFTKIEFTFNAPLDTLRAYGHASTETVVFRPNRGDVKRTMWSVNVPNPDSILAGDSIWFSGRGLKGSPIKMSYKWTTSGKPVLKGALPGKPAVAADAILRNQLLLPMPNLSNVGDDLNLLHAFPMTIGAPSGPKSVLIDNWKTATISQLVSFKTGKMLHTGPAVCFSDPKIFKKQIKGLSPKVFDDKLFAEVLSLGLNLKASKMGEFPDGLGSLVYNAPADSSDTSSSFFNGQTIDSIYAHANLWLTCPGGTTMSGDDVYFVVHRLNGAFADSGRVDTVSWSCNHLELKGVRRLSDVSFLTANPGTLQANAGKVKVALAVHPKEFALYQNYPNPFNPSTMIRFDVPKQSVVTLTIYNILGQEVATLFDHQLMDEGQHEQRFDASRLASGVYIYRMAAQPVVGDGNTVEAAYTSVKKMLLMK